MSESDGRAKYPLLAAAAYLLVPGQRRRKAAGHFRKAGFEAMKGINALAKPEDGDVSGTEHSERRNISID